jgi:hypothetical protein
MICGPDSRHAWKTSSSVSRSAVIPLPGGRQRNVPHEGRREAPGTPRATLVERC